MAAPATVETEGWSALRVHVRQPDQMV